MRLTRMARHTMHWLLSLAAGAALVSQSWAQNPASAGEKPATAAATVKSWESAEERLTMLLDQVPEQARPGIERALQANIEGRQKAQEALSRGDEQRAQRALEVAAARAEVGLNQARTHVPASVLPRLEEAAARMSARRPASMSGVNAAPDVDIRPTNRPTIEHPAAGMPGGMSNPAGATRPATPPPGRP